MSSASSLETAASTSYPAIEPAVLQRVRQHIIEYLEIAASFDEQRAYQARSPEINVPAEVLHQWEDWLTDEWQTRYADPVFSDEERAAMMEYHHIIDPLANGAIDTSPGLEQLCGMAHWQALRREAETILGVFMVRGKLKEQAKA
ncbi:hypothetical protein ACO0LO_05635 [Undibacterium sp. TJN25]|uniref:hypothetical protein n=1 Tax=Undibacterium sp. TJN25 TaxID=3413056 RepID=UPI003BF36399